MAQQTKRLTYFSVFMNALTGGRAYRGGPESPGGFLTLTCTGRKSGQPRQAHLLYIRDGADYVVTASNSGKPRNPGWFYNVRSNPQVSIAVHGTNKRAIAEVASPERRRELWSRLIEIAPMYAGYEKRVRREIPMVVLHPSDEPAAG
jgi:deazaflavin-dependent oxidoreductase (nitroreductase family)